MVTGAVGKDAVLLLLVGEAAQSVEGAANLEASSLLLILTLNEKFDLLVTSVRFNVLVFTSQLS